MILIMILLFKDNSVNYWVNNTVVDCGKSESTQITNIDFELPEDLIDITNIADTTNISNITDEELEDIIMCDNLLNKSNNKKLNNKIKHTNDLIINESRYEKIYFRGNTKVTNRNSGEKDSRSSIRKYKYKYKDPNTRVNDLQKTIEHKCLYKHSSSNYNQRKM